ncbi:unnamed protein product [Darwinula stevensoni]|uniref:Myb/SANT-like DNA-binding domain-containing protein n=1 Tax=Darwinula stevensoni TaxID=69355 RepID=A0A7R9A800_9CRUS|nr:unnamed protein product [Darwinula stevensoni]CAG0894297.1 unnamed protein product [Darwinula stevensoni]
MPHRLESLTYPRPAKLLRSGSRREAVKWKGWSAGAGVLSQRISEELSVRHSVMATRSSPLCEARIEPILIRFPEDNREMTVYLSQEDQVRLTQDEQFLQELLKKVSQETALKYPLSPSSDSLGSSASSSSMPLSPETLPTEILQAETPSTPGFTWTLESTKLLLTLILEEKGAFDDNITKKKTIWNRIALKMKAQDGKFQGVTGEICEKKFRNMKQTYVGIKDNNKSTGRKRKAWEFMPMMDDIFEKSPQVTPLSVIDSTKHNADIPETIKHANSSQISNPQSSKQEMGSQKPSISESGPPPTKMRCKGKVKDAVSNLEKAIRDYGMDRKKEHQEKMDVLRESKDLLEKRNTLLERLLKHLENK